LAVLFQTRVLDLIKVYFCFKTLNIHYLLRSILQYRVIICHTQLEIFQNRILSYSPYILKSTHSRHDCSHVSWNILTPLSRDGHDADPQYISTIYNKYTWFFQILVLAFVSIYPKSHYIFGRSHSAFCGQNHPTNI